MSADLTEAVDLNYYSRFTFMSYLKQIPTRQMGGAYHSVSTPFTWGTVSRVSFIKCIGHIKITVDLIPNDNVKTQASQL